ncbi:YraN family protein [Paenibacillus sp. CAU 1782]
MSDQRKQLGKWGEQEACRRLVDEGYEIRDVNWRCRSGEIDIVAEWDSRIIFVEVRSRGVSSLGRFGTAAESVDYRKIQKIRGAAVVYLQQKGLQERAIRFDVITVSLRSSGGPSVSHGGAGTGVSPVEQLPPVADYRHYEGAF